MRSDSILKLYREGLHSIRGIAGRLGDKTRPGLQRVQDVLGAAKLPVQRIWTKPEIEFLRIHYPTTPTLKLARHFNRTLNSVYAEAHALGLRRVDNPGNIQKGERRGIQWQFKKGNIPYNKGMKGRPSVGRMSETQFKKGHLPKNTLFDGAVAIRTDWHDKRQRKYKWIRIGLGKWKMLHVVVYEHFNGPVPPDHIVVFADGNSMDCRLDNLRCIDRVQHAEETRNKDEFIAKCLASTRGGGKGGYDRDLYRHLLRQPALLEVKRRQLQLKRTVQEHA